jgi:hypothetical protein
VILCDVLKFDRNVQSGEEGHESTFWNALDASLNHFLIINIFFLMDFKHLVTDLYINKRSAFP